MMSDGSRTNDGAVASAAAPSSDDGEADAASLLHDLRIHQLELLQQNRELRETRHALELSRDRYAHLYDRAPVGYCTLDRGGIIREINLTGATLLGVERDRLAGHPLGSHLDAGQGRAVQQLIQAAILDGARQTLIVRLTRPDRGETLHLRLDSEPAPTRGGEPLCLTVILDVTDQRKLMEQLHERDEELRHRALHDPLTRLPNRALFADLLEQAIGRAKRHGEGLAVLFIDLDRFKLINDTLGHQFGDEILRQVSDRLLRNVRVDDTVARIGGDEFLLLVGGLGSMEGAATVARKLIEAVSRPYPGPRGEVYLTVSIGISLFPDDGRTSEDLVRNADHAMYRAKQAGRSAFQFFTPEMTELSADRLELQASLARALERGELLLHYQPQFALSSGRICAVEALVRWQHPTLGVVDPDRFLPLAEETGLIRQIDALVLRAACTERRRWESLGLDPGTILKINLSKRGLERPGLTDELEAVTAELGLDPGVLSFEVVETYPILDCAGALDNADRLQRLGVELCLDHFGAVPCSIGDLRRLAVRELKIDRSLIGRLPNDPGEVAVVQAILGFGRALGLRVVAHGVETGAQAQFLRDAGCDRAQGYWFTGPLASDRFVSFFKEAARGMV